MAGFVIHSLSYSASGRHVTGTQLIQYGSRSSSGRVGCDMRFGDDIIQLPIDMSNSIVTSIVEYSLQIPVSSLSYLPLPWTPLRPQYPFHSISSSPRVSRSQSRLVGHKVSQAQESSTPRMKGSILRIQGLGWTEVVSGTESGVRRRGRNLMCARGSR
jgi:hypothetical protein